MSNIIEISHLHKAFGTVQAVQDLSFCVKEGEFFAFLGVNGAGKSTTINIMCAQLAKDGGSVVIDGEDIERRSDHIKRSLGVVFQQSVLDGALSVRDNLQSRAALYGIVGDAFKERLQQLCELFELAPILGQAVGKLSGGQRRRVDIARALLHRPRILILDEPTTGLDPQTRNLIWTVIDWLRREQGITVFLTTHYMEEAAEADYVVILDAGQIVAEGTPLQLKNAYASDFVTLYGVTEAQVASLGLPYQPLRDAWRLSVQGTGAAAALIAAHPQLFTDFEVTKGRMDDVFLAVTGKALGEGENK